MTHVRDQSYAVQHIIPELKQAFTPVGELPGELEGVTPELLYDLWDITRKFGTAKASNQKFLDLEYEDLLVTVIDVPGYYSMDIQKKETGIARGAYRIFIPGNMLWCSTGVSKEGIEYFIDQVDVYALTVDGAFSTAGERMYVELQQASEKKAC